jgi:hypothetical protein
MVVLDLKIRTHEVKVFAIAMTGAQLHEVEARCNCGWTQRENDASRAHQLGRLHVLANTRPPWQS